MTAIEIPTTYEVHVICTMWTTNGERRGMHWSKRQELVNAARWAAKISALDAKIPHLDRIGIVVQPMQSRRGPAADTGAYASVAKAAIDGLRDARVIDDDTSRYVSHIDYLPSIRTNAGATGLILFLTSEPVPAGVELRE